MGFTQTDLTNLEGDCGDDTMKHNREILITWRRKNSSTPDIISVTVNFDDKAKFMSIVIIDLRDPAIE